MFTFEVFDSDLPEVLEIVVLDAMVLRQQTNYTIHRPFIPSLWYFQSDRCPCCQSSAELVGLHVGVVVCRIGLMNHFGNEAMILVVFERYMMVGCFDGVMFGCTLVRCYGRMGRYHTCHR